MGVADKVRGLSNNTGFMKYLRNTSWLLGEKILRLGVGLFVGVWVARYLGPEQFGLFNYAQSFVALFATIATLGLDGIVIRELVKDENKREELLGTAFVLKLIGAALVLLFLAISLYIQSTDSQTTTLIFIIASSVVLQSFNVIDFYFQSKVMSKFVVYSNLLSFFISSIIKVLLIVNEAPLILFACVILFDSFILASGFVYFYIKNDSSIFTWKFSKHFARSLLKDSWPLMLSGMVISVYMKIDQVMIKHMLNAEAVGQYAAAVRISEAWYFIPMVIASSLFPAIINAKKISNEIYYNRLQSLYDIMTVISLSVAILMTFLGGFIINLLYGEQYYQSGHVFMIHIWAGLFVGLGVVRGKWIINENLQIYSFIYLGVALIINVILNYFLIESIGINGAAYATLASQCIAVIVAPSFIKKTRVSSIMMIKSIFLLPFTFKRLKQWTK